MATGSARPRSRPLPLSDAERRLRRMRALAWTLDRSIPIGRWRIGVDPILGLLPGAGDWLGALLSIFFVYEGARLGIPPRVLVRMAGNILLEAVVGTVPVLGDLFDCAWQANIRNVHLIEKHYHTGLKPRSFRAIGFLLLLFLVFVLVLIAGMIFLVAVAIRYLWSLVSA
jgi:hypothetical protein